MAGSPQTVGSVPQIFIKVVKAEGIRQHKGRDPTPSMLIRVSVAGEAQPQVLKTKPMNPGTDPSWNQEFMLPVPDPSAAQLECTIWDESDHQPQGYANFLGEVLLNLARLAPYKGHYIEQLFYIKQGKTIVTEEQASGNLKLGLRLDIPDDFTVPSRAPTASPAPPSNTSAQHAVEKPAEQNSALEVRKNVAEQQKSEEKEAQRVAEQQRQAAKNEQEAQRIAADEKRKAQEAQREAEMQRQAQMAEAQRIAEEQDRQKQLLLAEKAREQEEQARMRAQEQEMAKRAAQNTATSPPTRATSPPSAGSPVPRPQSPLRERPAQARIVIAVIEANELPDTAIVNPQAKITLQGPASLSTAQTRMLKNTREPLWNEKFVFGVEDENKDTTYICAEIISMPNEGEAVKLGAIQPVPVSTLMSGQKMSLPTVNQGNHIFCIDGWFEIFFQSPSSSFAAMTPTKTVGKSQIHLRMTFIPGAGAFDAQPPMSSPVPSQMAPAPPPAETQAPSSPPAQAAPSTPQLPMEPKPKLDMPGLPSFPQGFSPAQPRVLEHQEAPPRRLERERTPLPVKGGPADVGIVLKGGNPDGSLLVDEIIPGSPATEGAQIGRGDALIDVDGYDVVGRPVEDAQGLLRGPPNSPVTMILQRGGKGGEPIVVTLLRAVPGGMAVHPTQSSMPTRASAPLPPQAPPVRASNAEAHLQPTSTPHLSATPTSDLTEMHKALCTEFQNISFLWTDSEHPDPMVLALVEWKDDLLYGGPKKASSSGTPPSAALGEPIWPPESRYPSIAMSSSSIFVPSYAPADPLAQTATPSGSGSASVAAEGHQAAA